MKADTLFGTAENSDRDWRVIEFGLVRLATFLVLPTG